MKLVFPPKVDDSTEYWTEPPPERSARCAFWVNKIRNGWMPNRRIGQMDTDEASQFYGVYIWEYVNIIYPMFHVRELVSTNL